MRRKVALVAAMGVLGAGVAALFLQDASGGDVKDDAELHERLGGDAEKGLSGASRPEVGREAASSPMSSELLSRASKPSSAPGAKSDGTSSPPLLVEEDYYALNTYGDQALVMPLDTLEWATEDEHWNPGKKKLSEKTREELKKALAKWREDVMGKHREFFKELNVLANRDVESGKLAPVDRATIDTRQVRYHEKVYIGRGSKDYVFDIVPRDSETLVHPWTAMLQAKISLESDLRRFFRELD